MKKSLPSINTQVTNILAAYHNSSEKQRLEGLSWYTRAKEIAIYIADQHNLPVHTVCGVIAALSPGTNWIQNIIDSINLIRGHKAGYSFQQMVVTTYNKNKFKALKILDNKLSEKQILRLLIGCYKEVNKTSAFFTNIFHPEKQGPVTIDRHSFRVNLAVKEIPEIWMTEKRYRDLSSAYVIAGKKVGLRAHEVQAITWIQFRDTLDTIVVKPSANLDRYVYSKVIYGSNTSVFTKNNNDECPF